MPALTNANDIGTETHQWRNIYYEDTLQGGSAHVEELTANTGAIANELTVADYIAVGGGYGNSGTTLDSNGNLQLDGNIEQDRGMGGAVKAMAYIDGSNTGCVITGSYNYLGQNMTCTRSDTGRYVLDFGFNVHDRFIQYSPWNDPNPATCQGSFVGVSNNREFKATYRDSITGSFRDGDFMLTVY